ncbi:hypothetical protein FLM9_763 [Candidatus Synechococcus spongiarum]|uniref:Fatty acid hydroxylase domain-containing protein n=1 Tax=Candidatus Synechococcus spongiarum TaxID=431041 RepID=A0A171DGH3_9SYNE|nr:sterol desaturase family protein [Candidatus Synechococcus spongiarum]SAY38795.1 hypothetical protein FLM9_763 [Candidatus Synechococcus spongiarum]
MLGWKVIADAFTNFITLAAYITISFVALAVLYLGVYYTVYQYFSLTQIPVTLWSIAFCVVLADLAYYFEHRFLDRVGIAWVTHTVHYSSPYFNISVAYHFGSLDGFFPVFFHIPLVFVGLDPIVVFFSEAVVQLYQTILHTEVIKTLPKPVEAVVNNPFTPPRPPREQPAVHRQELRRNFYSVGLDVRHVCQGARARDLRHHGTTGHGQPVHCLLPRIDRAVPEDGSREGLARQTRSPGGATWAEERKRISGA